MDLQNITDVLRTNFMPYAMSVIISRAIPEIDGFKPSHRKLLYTMYKMGLLTGNRTKSANVVGQTMKLNPHGDMAIYETMVRLTRSNESLLYPYVDSKGNFGKVYSRDMAFAASRYTEVKLESLCFELFKNIDKDTVDFVDNYDGTLKEPTLFPVTFPTILTNPNLGIAVGMASNIASFNLGEVCDAEIAYLENENADMADYIKAPDFPTGGYLIYDEEQMRAILDTGRGSFKIRAKYQYDAKENLIEILEIPYSTTSEAIVDKVVENIKAGKLKEVADIRDETGLNGLKITLDLKRGTDPEMLMLKLFKMTPLEDSFSCNFNILINGSPEVLGVKGILANWTTFRIQCIKRQTRFDISAKSEKLHLLNGLKKILLDIDKAVKIVRETEDDTEVIPNLMKGFSIDEKQAEFVAEIKLRNLNKKYILNKVDEIENLRKELEDLNRLLADPALIKEQIIKELTAIKKKYSKPRKSEILTTEEIEHFSEDMQIEDYNLKLFLTKQGYLKKIPLTSLRAGGEHKFKEGDKLVKEFDETNLGELLVFTNRQNVYKIKIYEIADTKLSGMGEFLKSVLGCEPEEEIIDVFSANAYKGHFLFAFENGKMAKIPLASYETKTNRKKLVNSYSDASKLIKILYLPEDTDIVSYSSNGKILVFHSSSINPKTTRSSNGVNVMTLRRGAALKKVVELARTRLKEPDYYRTKNIPAVGCFQKEDGDKQVKMFE
ncbi:DNA topoisomerase (ATP-hydrolyzing) subunit A [Acetivibrio sp. MSJd-27]|uniref:DNA gyrase/topoisomerase IV subunit A n=1 Tax=Acetivibrio sp. MSJd-27 TaxID=2841523 RepID=UPI0020A15D59|nr:DNA topoisomerase (ATP-hydrolyzing) subunit A [Acetivibrio sp. MSJd-27]